MSKTESSPSRLKPEIVMLGGAALLAPIIGGHVPTDAQPLTFGLFSEIFGGGALPITARLVIALLIFAGIAITFLQNRVVQLPQIKFVGLLIAFITILGFSGINTEFRYIAFREWIVWIVYSAALLLPVCVGGRKKNLIITLSCIGVGTSILALKGIGQYAQRMAIEPTFRIFADWNNPNALASMLILGLIVLLGLTIYIDGIKKLIPASGAVLAAAALVLTQSKGGYLAIGVGVFVFVILLLAFRQYKSSALVIAPLILGAALGVGITQVGAAQAQSSGPGLSRITDTSSTTEQSAGFRQNLWKTSLQLGQANIMGTGIGTFRYYSAQPGLVDQTVFAHQAFLQLFAESGIIALGLFLSLALFWLILVFKGTKIQPPKTLVLKATIVAAVLGFSAHGMVESNLSFFGTGIIFFILLGIGLQLSSDASSPEALPKQLRSGFALAGCGLPLLALLLQSASEVSKATFVTALSNPNPTNNSLPDPTASAYGDPESLYLSTLNPAMSPQDRYNTLKTVASQMPTPKILRAAARAAEQQDDNASALAYLNKVFIYDPNNLPAFNLKVDLLIKTDDLPEAINTANALILVEESVAFQVRAIPELVPTETYEARLFLATQTSNQEEKYQLLQDAIQGFATYANTTVPKLIAIRQMFIDANEPYTEQMVTFGPENITDSRQKLETALNAAKEIPTNAQTPEFKENVKAIQETLEKI